MIVIDPPFRFSQSGRVLTEPDIRAELVRQLSAGLVTGVQVAEHLGVPAPRVSEIKAGRRRIQHHEMKPLAALLGMDDSDVSMALVSEGELAEILAEVQGQMPALLPTSEWPRYVAEALKLRLDLLSRDRAKADR